MLVEPEIAPNTGNIIRLCAITGSTLHLVEPLGFDLDDRLLKRGGLDYHERAELDVHPDLDAALADLPGRVFVFSSHNSRPYVEVDFEPDDVLVFGSERAGLGPERLAAFGSEQRLHIPMRPGNRSLNLANAVAVVVYEAWRQRGFDGAGDTDLGLTSERPGLAPFDR